MNTDKKIAVQQQHIEAMETELKRLQQENESLKQLVPDGTEIAMFNAAMSRLQADLAAALVLKTKYEAAVEHITTLKQNYQTEMDSLLARLRGGVEKSEQFDKVRRSHNMK